MAELTPVLLLEEDEEPMATERIYLASDESEYSTLNTNPEHHYKSIYPDSINHLIAPQSKQWSNMGTETVFYRPTTNTSMISDDEEQSNLTPIIGDPEQNTSQIPQRRNHRLQLCQHLQPVPDTPESPPPEDQSQRSTFRLYDLPNRSTSASYANPPISRQWLMGCKVWHCNPITQRNEWVTGCLVCRKSYDQVIEGAVANYLSQTAQPCETVRERHIKRNALIDDIQSGEFNLLPREVRRLPPVTAWCTLSITRAKNWACWDTRCPCLKIKLTKLSLNFLLDKFRPPLF